MSRKRYVQVGLGGRSRMYFYSILQTYADTSEMAAVCDVDEGRVALAIEEAREMGATVKGYPARSFDQMIAETKPNTVIVTTKDCTPWSWAVTSSPRNR